MNYFSIDFLKFILMFAMVARHVPLILYSQPMTEYSIEQLNFYSFFIPATSGFIFILGYGLSLSLNYKTSNKLRLESKKYLKVFALLFLLSIIFAFISFFIKKIDLTFLNYFFLYQWNTIYKPSFYILLPISLIYLMNYIIYKFLHQKFLILFLCFIFSLYFSYLYTFHYFLFGLIGYILAIFIDIKKILEFNTFLIINIVLIYFSFFLFGYAKDINFILELILLILFIIFIIHISKNFIYFQKSIQDLSKSILIFYIFHVLFLNIIKPFILLSSWTELVTFTIVYFLFSILISRKIDSTIKRYL